MRIFPKAYTVRCQAYADYCCEFMLLNFCTFVCFCKCAIKLLSSAVTKTETPESLEQDIPNALQISLLLDPPIS